MMRPAARILPRWLSQQAGLMQLVAAELTVLVLALVWLAAGGTRHDVGAGRPWVAVSVTLAGIVTVTVITEVEARATERWAERRRLEELFGIGIDTGPATVPVGYVLAYQLTAGDMLLGNGAAPTVTVAAIPADRWDLNRALWKVRIDEQPWPRASRLEGGTRMTVWNEAYPALAQLAPVLQEFAAGRPDRLAVVEAILAARGARNVTAAVTS